jgi:hypothetical protein
MEKVGSKLSRRSAVENMHFRIYPDEAICRVRGIIFNVLTISWLAVLYCMLSLTDPKFGVLLKTSIYGHGLAILGSRVLPITTVVNMDGASYGTR